MASTALPRSLLFLLHAGVPLALAATAPAAQAEFPYAAGTDSTGRARAVSDAAGRVLIESPEFPRGLWVDLFEAGLGRAMQQAFSAGRVNHVIFLTDGLPNLGEIELGSLKQNAPNPFNASTAVAAISVRAKSSRLSNRGSPVVRASAQAKQSPKLSAAAFQDHLGNPRSS